LSNGNDHNLLVALEKWASRQGENFLTDAFAHLLRHLRDNEPEAFVEVLSFLTDGRLTCEARRAGAVEITTQVAKDEGRPDMEIRSGAHLVYVEAKVESGLGWRQLKRYRAALEKEDAERKTLVLLTRYHVEPDDATGEPHVCRRWYAVADRLSRLLQLDAWQDPLSGFLTRQLVEFLQEKGMTMEQVTWELRNGVRAMWDLLEIVGEALLSQNAKLKWSVGREWAGHGVNERTAWVGIAWEEPEQLFFHTWEYPTPENGAEIIGYGEVRPYRWSSTGFAWYNTLDLAAEDVHFFARSRESQMRCIEEFVKRSLDGLGKLEASRQGNG